MIKNNYNFKIIIVGILLLVLLFPTSIGITSNIKLKTETRPLNEPPSSFDLRDVNGENYVTGIRDQGGYGTCWTHGAMASIEGNLLITDNWADAGETGEPSLSEAHLDWWNGFNTHNNDDDPGGGGLSPHWGGDYMITSAYITRGEGVVREIDAPYDNIDDPCSRYDPDFHHFYSRDIEWYVAGYDLSNINTIKNMLMEEGVIGTAMCWGYYDYETNSHYQPIDSSDDPNHAIAIIGWDDEKITQAPDAGAWLCKNSWGEDFGEEGYFWISYYDKWCGQHPEMGAVSFQDVEFEPYGTFYYHDYHGWRDTITEVSEAFNVFSINGAEETLIAVSIFTAVDNVDYDIIIYDDFYGGELKNSLSTVTGNEQYCGFHTIDLDTPITLTSGDDFYVYVKLSNGGHPIDRTSEVPVLLGANSRGTIVQSYANPEESYYMNGVDWMDLYDYEFSDSSWDNTANFCIKAITGEFSSVSSDLKCTGSCNWNNIKPNREVKSTITVENIGDESSQLDWKVDSWPEWGDWNFNPQNGYNLKPEDGKISVQVNVVAPEDVGTDFSGEIKIVNKENNDDYEIIEVRLNTPKYKNSQILSFFDLFPFLSRLINLFMN